MSGSRRYRHPALLRFMLGHFVAGSVGAVVFVAALLATDYMGLASMAAASPHGVLLIVMLLVALCLTFGSVAIGIGVMRDRD